MLTSFLNRFYKGLFFSQHQRGVGTGSPLGWSISHSHVFVQPVEHIRPGLLDAGLVRWVDVLALAVDKPMSLTRKDLHLVISLAVLLQLRLECTHLEGANGCELQLRRYAIHHGGF